MQMHTEAEKIFIAVGKKLKKRRNIDDGTVMYSYLKPDDSGDPAAENQDLDNKLLELGKVAERKINKVFEEYVEKQASGAKPNDDDDGDNTGQDSDTEVEEDEENVTLDHLSEAEEQSHSDGDASINDVVDLGSDDNIEKEDDDAISDPHSDSSCGSINNLLEESDHE